MNKIDDQLVIDVINQLRHLNTLKKRIEGNYDDILEFWGLLEDPDFTQTLEKMQLEEKNPLTNKTLNLKETSYESQNQMENIIAIIDEMYTALDEWLEELDE